MEKSQFLNNHSALNIWKQKPYLSTNKNLSNLHYLCDMKKIIPIEEGDFYLTPEGYRCFTEQYHLKRGYCCESGCRHCPYGFNASASSKSKSSLKKK